MITTDQIEKVMPSAKKENIERYFPFWLLYLPKYEVTGSKRVSAYFAQIAHESWELNAVQENLNYSTTALLKTWPRRFTVFTAAKYARNPEKIANKVYANRNGNGPEESGDGWKYRGRGLIQITFLSNYRACSRDIYKDDRLVINPEILELPGPAVESSLWYWKTRGLNLVSDSGDFEKLTRLINGGLNGLEDRLKYYKRATETFKTLS